MPLFESTTIELKQEYTSDLIKTIVAFANTSGGILYIGITDDSQIIGITDADGIMLKAGNAIRGNIKPDVTMFVDYQHEIMEGKPVLKIVVQKGSSGPYYLASKGIRPEGVYVRQGASSVPSTSTAILRMIKDTDGEKYEELRSLNQDLTFDYAQKEFGARNVPFGTNQQKTLGLMKGDKIYTNLGQLISDQCVHTVKLAVFDGHEKAQFKDRREFSGSILKQLNEIYAFIDRYNRNRSEIDGLHRIDRRDYPVEAVREALLNALVHRDYAFSDSTLISIFDDRIELVSIGGLVRGITLNDILIGVSVVRNRNLADIFYRLTLIEAYGTGMPRIMRSYNEYPMKPQVNVSDNAFKIILPNINEFAEKLFLHENEQIVMALLAERKFITRKNAETALNVSQAMALRVLKRLVDKNMIHIVRQGKNTRYTL